MRYIIEGFFMLLTAGAVGGTSLYIVTRKHPRQLSAPDQCKHRRWTKWKIEQLKTIHIYPDSDDGAELPDRVDAYLTRECLRCGQPQAKTVRGIDSQHYK